MTGLIRHRAAAARGRATEGEDSARCGDPLGGPRRAWTRALQGAALAFGAPLGWLALRVAAGHDAGAELAASAPLYLYMLLGSVVMFTGFGAALGKHEDCLIAANRSLDELSVSDPVTGLRNARYFRERLREAQARAQRSGEPLSIVVMDLDRFKRVNDRYGHPVGDEVLVAVSAAITGAVRSGDTAVALPGTAARMGGEEFALLLPDTDAFEARAVAERVRRAVREAVVRTAAGEEVRITISCGVASGHPVDEDGGQAIYAAADQAMYAAKRAGRNRTRVHGGPSAEPAPT
ncbi:MAG TPA: GGDEF domain-containing protein [Longimicrobium sp.]|nr:GGDEF domain-containing protein [Longimicrobium sp.]